jgi:hypothetical protein
MLACYVPPVVTNTRYKENVVNKFIRGAACLLVALVALGRASKQDANHFCGCNNGIASIVLVLLQHDEVRNTFISSKLRWWLASSSKPACEPEQDT